MYVLWGEGLGDIFINFILLTVHGLFYCIHKTPHLTLIISPHTTKHRLHQILLYSLQHQLPTRSVHIMMTIVTCHIQWSCSVLVRREQIKASQMHIRREKSLKVNMKKRSEQEKYRGRRCMLGWCRNDFTRSICMHASMFMEHMGLWD